MNLTEIWSRLANGDPTAAAFAGEGVVLGDSAGLVVRVALDGEVQWERPLPSPIHEIAASVDGRVLAITCGEGEVLLLEEDRIVFRKSPGPYLTMTRLGPDASYLLAMAPSGEGIFFNRYGREMSRISVPEGADSVVVVPRTGKVVTANSDGIVQCFAPWGKPLWRAELGMDAGRISTDARGDLVLVPVMVYGATALTAEGQSVGAYDVGEPIGAADCDASGKRILLATLRNRLVVLDRDASVQSAEKFPAEVRDVRLSEKGDTAIVLTASGYTHLISITDDSDGPRLELSGSGNTSSGGTYLFRRRIFSPYMILMPPRVGFSDDRSFVAVAGGGGRSIVFDLDGEKIDARRFEGSILDLTITPSGTVRVISTRTVLGYQPGERDGARSWDTPSELYQVSAAADGPTLALSEDGDLLRIGDEGEGAEHLFTLPPKETGEICATKDSIAVSLKTGDVLIHSHEGEVVGHSGPWPVKPRVLAAGPEGFLVAVEKLILLLEPDGTEKWRYHLATPPRYGVAVPGAFLVVDEPGAAFSATTTGVLRRTFAVGRGSVIPYPDAGEGPGFLKAEGKQLTAIHPDGRPCWRCRLPDDIGYMRASRDGTLAGVVAGLDFYVFALTRDSTSVRDLAEASRFLEFVDG